MLKSHSPLFRQPTAPMQKPIQIISGDCCKHMRQLHEKHGEFVDLIFCDPPYFLSNGGISCHNGKMVKVDKGAWDQSAGADRNHQFNRQWLTLCQQLLKPNGTIMVSGTLHVIYSVGFAMQQLGFKLLNNITWQKPNPPPNLSCRYFTHSTETVIWAAKNSAARHTFNYALMKQLNGDRQMKDVWQMTAPGKAEKSEGKHPTQKPLALLERLITAATDKGELVLDPFNGSGTTGIACLKTGRRYIGIELDKEFVELTRKRIRQARKEAPAAGSERQAQSAGL